MLKDKKEILSNEMSILMIAWHYLTVFIEFFL